MGNDSEYNQWEGQEGLQGVGLERKKWIVWLLWAITTLLTLAVAIFMIILYANHHEEEEKCIRPLARWALGEGIVLCLMPSFWFALSSPHSRSKNRKKFNLIASSCGCLALMFVFAWAALGVYWVWGIDMDAKPPECMKELHDGAVTGQIMLLVLCVVAIVFMLVAGKPSMAIF